METFNVDDGVPSELDPELEQPRVRMFRDNLDDESFSYAPSIAQTDFSEFLPEASRASEEPLDAGYSAEAIVGSAWTNLSAEEPKTPWDGDFWGNFLNPNISALDR